MTIQPDLPSSAGAGAASGHDCEHGQDIGKKAWVTLITNESYVAGLITLHRTLISVSSYPLIAMTTTTLALSRASRDLIKSFSIPIIEVAHLSVSAAQHAGFDPSFARFDDTWTKLQVFGLTQFERVILIDSDMIFLKGMDELFDLELGGSPVSRLSASADGGGNGVGKGDEREWIAAAPACVCNPLRLQHYPKDWIPANCSFRHQSPTISPSSTPIPELTDNRTAHLLNSGLVILHPSLQTLEALVHHIQTSPTIASLQFPDQDVLAEVFKGRWKPLPWWCNALKTLRAVHQDVWRDEEVRLIHYILDKPWHRRPAQLPAYQSPSAPPTPVTATNSTSFPHLSDSRPSGSNNPHDHARRPLPTGLLEAAKRTPPQSADLKDYQDVHTWWWIVYEDLIDELQSAGDMRWKQIDAHVKR